MAANAPTAQPITNGTPALEVRSISKYFGSVNALEDISLSVYSGQVDLRTRRQRRRQVDADQDPLRRVHAGQG